MKREEFVKALCESVARVGTEVFGCQESMDCFCSYGYVSDPEVADKIIEYVCQAVEDKIARGETY